MVLDGVQATKNGYEARCPAHDDDKSSLCLSEGEDGRVLLHCQAGCGTTHIVKALGMEMRDLFPSKKKKREGKVVAEYHYTDEQGKVLHTTLRYEPKGFAQGRRENNKWVGSLKGIRTVLFRLPKVREAIVMGRTIYLCEGEKDVLAIEAKGEVATCNPMGAGKWDPSYTKSLEGADVAIVRDKDHAGAEHVRLVYPLLLEACRSVRVVQARDAGERQNKDVYDHLEHGFSIEEFEPVDDPMGNPFPKKEPAKDKPAPQPELDDDDYPRAGPYVEKDGRLMLSSRNDEGKESFRQLANFTCRINEELMVDDGDEPRRVLMVQAQKPGSLPLSPIELPAKEFAGMAWVVDKLGASFIVASGNGTKDRVREAVQLFSDPVPQRLVYAHTGWRSIGGSPVYLTGKSAIGKEGFVEGVDVNLGSNLSRFGIERTDWNERECLEASLRLFDLATPLAGAALLGAVFLSPLVPLFKIEQPNFVVWLYGESGSFKSELAALAQSHWGNFLGGALPGSFLATANALERQWFTLKDALFVIDDCYPSDNPKESANILGNVDRILRGYGNRKGRDRMRQDTTMREGLPPRGMAMATSERLPSLHSTMARMFPVEVRKGDVQPCRLTDAQDARRHLQGAMFAFVRWIAHDPKGVGEEANRMFRNLRAFFSGGGSHNRQPSQAAHLLTGLLLFMKCAEEHGAISQERKQEIDEAVTAAMLEGLADQGATLAEMDPVEKFMTGLRQAINARYVYLDGTDGKGPEEPERWGWVERSYGKEAWEKESVPGKPGNLVGYVDDRFLYLFPERTLELIRQFAGKESPPIDRTSLGKQMDAKGYIEAKVESEGSRTVRRVSQKLTINKVNTRYWKLRMAAYAGKGEPPGREPTEAVRTDWEEQFAF